MSVRIEKDGPVWTVIHSRADARNAVHPASADALIDAFVEFDRDEAAAVAVFWGEGGAFCAGWDLKHAASLDPTDPFPKADDAEDALPPGPMGPSRLLLDKPVIAAVAGPAVAGGMELALWCDLRVMEQSAYLGVYNRRWGIPLIDGGTVRLPRLVGQGRAMELILTGRKVTAAECERIGLCEYVVEDGRSREKAEELAHEIARFPQACVRADRRSVILQQGLSLRDALAREWANGLPALIENGIAGADRFRNGLGRHGDFGEI
jgi:enoyl-CoA hydratase